MIRRSEGKRRAKGTGFDPRRFIEWRPLVKSTLAALLVQGRRPLWHTNRTKDPWWAGSPIYPHRRQALYPLSYGVLRTASLYPLRPKESREFHLGAYLLCANGPELRSDDEQRPFPVETTEGEPAGGVVCVNENGRPLGDRREVKGVGEVRSPKRSIPQQEGSGPAVDVERRVEDWSAARHLKVPNSGPAIRNFDGKVGPRGEARAARVEFFSMRRVLLCLTLVGLLSDQAHAVIASRSAAKKLAEKSIAGVRENVNSKETVEDYLIFLLARSIGDDPRVMALCREVAETSTNAEVLGVVLGALDIINSWHRAFLGGGKQKEQLAEVARIVRARDNWKLKNGAADILGALDGRYAKEAEQHYAAVLRSSTPAGETDPKRRDDIYQYAIRQLIKFEPQ